jgi:hypothetical protein
VLKGVVALFIWPIYLDIAFSPLLSASKIPSIGNFARSFFPMPDESPGSPGRAVRLQNAMPRARQTAMTYPVSVHIDPKLDHKDRLTCAFRPILAIPHAVLVGPLFKLSPTVSSPGLLTAVAYFLAIVNWFAILFMDKPRAGIREFCLSYLGWRTRALAYMALFVDAYPPFGPEPYPASISVAEPADSRDRVSIALRLLFALPQLVAVAVLLVVWLFVTLVAWVVVVFTGSYPASLYPFASGIMSWVLRVEAYLLLLVDEYPPFSMD